MKQSQFYTLLDILEDIKGVDKMILLHLNDDSAFMLDQYKSKKEKLVSNLIDKLISPSLMSARSIHTIKMVIDRFYGDEMKKLDSQSANDELSKLEHALA
jgi:hypothetical protein